MLMAGRDRAYVGDRYLTPVRRWENFGVGALCKRRGPDLRRDVLRGGHYCPLNTTRLSLAADKIRHTCGFPQESEDGVRLALGPKIVSEGVATCLCPCVAARTWGH